MIYAVFRKARRVAADPVLRRWLIGAAFGRYEKPAPFVVHRPSYLHDLAGQLDTDDPIPAFDAPELSTLYPRPSVPIRLALPGQDVTLMPGDEASFVTREFSDTETLLAMHRFAWLPLAGHTVDPGWVDVIWRSWLKHHGRPDSGWAWHPYTAAERVINILDFARRCGWPGDRGQTLAALAAHAPAIFGRLEYFGEHDTSNHLSNNGRGLYRLGLDLRMPKAAEAGMRILRAEAERIFRPSGILREGSSHYHVLLTRNYADAWLAARRHGRAEAEALRTIFSRAVSILPRLTLPGRFPLIGDISPDCPPEFLGGLLPNGNPTFGWCGLLDADDRAALTAVLYDAGSSPALDGDGWCDLRYGAWSALSYVAPDGWQPMPGHGHQDIGSIELHFDSTPILVDPGRGGYGEHGDAGFYATAAAHNTMTIEGVGPYPPNKPYYGSNFRLAVCGPPPEVTRHIDGFEISHGGFGYKRAIGRAVRNFKFAETSVQILDRIEGHGKVETCRRLYTPWPVEGAGNEAFIRSPIGRFRIMADAEVRIYSTRYWQAYGRSAEASAIEFPVRAFLPASLFLSIDKVAA